MAQMVRVGIQASVSGSGAREEQRICIWGGCRPGGSSKTLQSLSLKGLSEGYFR